jgi:hypothetical protein
VKLVNNKVNCSCCEWQVGTEAAPRKLVTLRGCTLDKQFINTYSISTYRVSA